MRLLRLFKNDLAGEVSTWVKDGLINAHQAEAICQRYGIDYRDQSRHSMGYLILVSLGYLFIGLAVITLIGANWEDIPRAVRMLGLIFATLLVNLLGVYYYRQANNNAAIMAFFFGGLLYGASIMLIAQIYHIGEHFPDGIYWWALGVLPAALLLHSRLLMLLAISLAAIWFLVEVNMGYYPASTPLFLAALAWLVLYRLQDNLMFLILVAGIVLWLEYSLAWWQGAGVWIDPGTPQLTLGVGLMAFAYALSSWMSVQQQGKWKDYGVLLNVWALRLALVFLLVMSFEGLWPEFGRVAADDRLINLVIVVVCSLLTIALHVRAAAEKLSGIAFALIYAAMFLAALFLNQIPALSFQVMDNLILVAMGIWLIYRGITRDISHHFYLGVATILITGLVRYIDLVGDYIGAAILFMVFAMILLASARYWKLRHAQPGAGHD